MFTNEERKSGIHTLMFSKKNAPEVSKKLLRELEKHSKINKCRWIPNKNESTSSWKTWTLYLHQKGINIELAKISDDPSSKRFVNYFIYYEINPMQIMDNRNSLEICLSSNFADVCDRVDDITGSINTSLSDELLPLMREMRLVRIDLCSNVKLDVDYFDDPDNIVNEYIRLLKKYGKYKGFTLKKPSKDDDYNEEASIELEKGDITLYIYNKHTEVKSKPNVCSQDEIADSFAILRIELRLHNSKIYNDKKQSGISDNIEFLNKSVIESQDKIENYLRKLFFTGDYWSYSKAIEMIENNKQLKTKTKENLCKLLFYIKRMTVCTTGLFG